MRAWLQRRVFFFAALAIAALALVLVVHTYPEQPGLEWLDNYCTTVATTGSSAQAVPDASETPLRHIAECPRLIGSDGSVDDKAREQLAKVAEKRMDAYHDELGELRTNLWIQLIVMAIAFAILHRKVDDTIKIPFIDFKLEVRWASVLVPLILVYLYITFGFVFDHLIQERYILWRELMQLEDNRVGHSIHSMRMMLDDRWVMDTWFAEFHPDAISYPVLQPAGVVVFLLVFGAIIAAQHACALLLLVRTDLPGGKYEGSVRWILFLVVAGLYAFSHYAFLVWGQNPNWVQLEIGGVVLIALAVVSAGRRSG